MFELELLAAEDKVESVSDALLEELEARSVSLQDADAASDAEQPLYGEPGLTAPLAFARSVVCALFDTEPAAARAASLLIARDAAIQLRSMRPLPDEDWVRLTQSQFEPVAITPRFWIVPSWHEAPAAARQLIRLDPGLAFGTGTHPTTRMCLRWIARHARAWPRVLDYGCGSGILAIAAALHGAGEVDAVDIDPAALQATLANAQANNTQVNAAPPAAARGGYALVLANILAAPLQMLAPLLSGHVASGGQLVLAGILERQADALRLAYAPYCRLEVSDLEDGWILMSGTRSLDMLRGIIPA